MNMDEKKRVLVIEDDLFLRDIYIEVLNNAGLFVDSAEDGEKGYEKIIEGKWDLVLLDIIMPHMSGVDVMKKLHERLEYDPKTYYKKLVFLTNLDSDKEIKEAMQYGDGYLIKSQLTPGDILNEVIKYLS